MENHMSKQAAESTFDRATDQILVGLAITSLTLNFAYLNLILPAIGVILMYFGMRSLRRTNWHFRWGYRLTILELVVFLLGCWWSASIYSSLDGAAFDLITNGLSCVGALLKIGIAVSLCRGLEKVCGTGCRPKETPGENPKETPGENRKEKPKTEALWFLVLLLIFSTLAALFGGILALLPWAGMLLVILYILDYIALYRMWKSWRNLEIVVEKAESRVRQGVFFLAYIVLLAAGIVSSCFAFSRYPMAWTAENSGSTENTGNSGNSGSTENAGSRGNSGSTENAGSSGNSGDADAAGQEYSAEIERLTNLGAPEYILEDLSAEELDLLQDAVDVEVMEDVEGGNSGISGLHISHLCFCLNEEKTEYAILHYFRWDDDARLCGTDAVDISTACGRGEWNLADQPGGRLLYDDGDTTFTGSWQDFAYGAAAASGGDDGISDESEVFLFLSDSSCHVKGGCSFKNSWKNRRGYLLYEISYYDPYAEADQIPLFWDCAYFTHQKSFLQYPYVKSVDYNHGQGASGNGFTVKPFEWDLYEYTGFKDGVEE